MAEGVPIFLDADPTSLVPKIAGSDARITFRHLQAGVFTGTDLLVTAGSSGLSVDVASGRGIVHNQTANVAGQKYAVFNDATKNSANFEAGGIPANGSANPRLDAVVAQVWDHAVDGSGLRKWRLVYVVGSPSAGAALGGTLPSLPATSLLLAEVLTPGGNPTSIPGANVRDRRSWARGFATYVDGLTSGPTVASTTEIVLPEMTVTAEFSGAPVEVVFNGEFTHSLANNWISTRVRLDAAGNIPFVQDSSRKGNAPGVAGNPVTFPNVQRFPISTPGRHTIDVVWATQAATATAAGRKRQLIVREDLRDSVQT